MSRTLVCDQQLVREYLTGNHSSLETLIHRHKKRIYGYVLMMVKDQHLAEDIFQDTFIKVINKLRSGAYSEEGKFLQWVMRIAHNITIDHFRKNGRIPTIKSTDEFNIFDKIKLYDNNREDEMIKEQIHEDLRRLIELLPDEQKEVLKMRHYSDMSFKEIAETTNVSINTALGRMRYALINLRKMIEEKKMIMTM